MDRPQQNLITPQRQLSGQPHPLNRLSRNAAAATADLYEGIVSDYERMLQERIREIDMANQQGQTFLDWLGQILKLIGGKRDDENVVGAVQRYVDQAMVLDSRRVSEMSAARLAFRTLCDRHNIIPPCGYFSHADAGTTGPLRACDGCGHPWLMHEPTPSETAS